jgi:hypothetical protein
MTNLLYHRQTAANLDAFESPPAFVSEIVTIGPLVVEWKRGDSRPLAMSGKILFRKT